MNANNMQAAAEGVTLADVSGFLGQAWKWILGGAVVGGLLVAAYVAFVPHKYGATAILRMAQLPVRAATGGYEKANVEAPAILVDKLQSPSSYPPEVLAACGVQALPAPGEALVRRLTLKAREPDVVALSVRADSPAMAQACMTAVVGLARALQAADSKPTIDPLRERLRDLQARLADSRAYTDSLAKAGSNPVGYLAARDDLTYLRTHIDEVRNALRLQTDTQSLAPVYAPAEPMFPGRPVALAIIAIVAGALAGLLVTALRNFR